MSGELRKYRPDRSVPDRISLPQVFEVTVIFNEVKNWRTEIFYNVVDLKREDGVFTIVTATGSFTILDGNMVFRINGEPIKKDD